MIYVISRGGITEWQMKTFFNIVQFSYLDQDALKNLAILGINTISKGKPFKPSKYYADVQSKAVELNRTDYVQARYEPLFSVFVRKLHDSMLSESDFPFCGDVNSVDDIDDSIGGKDAFDRSRIIVF